MSGPTGCCGTWQAETELLEPGECLCSLETTLRLEEVAQWLTKEDEELDAVTSINCAKKCADADLASMIGCVAMRCFRLQVLNLSTNQIGDDGASAIAESLPLLPTRWLTSLDLSDNRLTAGGAAALARGFVSYALGCCAADNSDAQSSVASGAASCGSDQVVGGNSSSSSSFSKVTLTPRILDLSNNDLRDEGLRVMVARIEACLSSADRSKTGGELSASPRGRRGSHRLLLGLRLRSTRCTIHGLEHLLRLERFLSELDVSDNPLSQVAVSKLCSTLQHSRHWRRLAVSDLVDPAAGVMSSLMRVGRRPSCLVEPIVDCARHALALRELSCGNKYLGDDRGALLAAALSERNSDSLLERLELRDSRCGLKTSMALSQLLSLPESLAPTTRHSLESGCVGLRLLDLDANDLDDKCVRYLAEGFARSLDLEVLRLGSNKITCAGAIALARAITGQRRLAISCCRRIQSNDRPGVLVALDLSYNRVGDDGVEAIAIAAHAAVEEPAAVKLSVPWGLEYLNLTGNSDLIGDRGRGKLCAAVAARAVLADKAAEQLALVLSKSGAAEPLEAGLRKPRSERVPRGLEVIGLEMDDGLAKAMSQNAFRELRKLWPRLGKLRASCVVGVGNYSVQGVEPEEDGDNTSTTASTAVAEGLGDGAETGLISASLAEWDALLADGSLQDTYFGASRPCDWRQLNRPDEDERMALTATSSERMLAFERGFMGLRSDTAAEADAAAGGCFRGADGKSQKSAGGVDGPCAQKGKGGKAPPLPGGASPGKACSAPGGKGPPLPGGKASGGKGPPLVKGGKGPGKALASAKGAGKGEAKAKAGGSPTATDLNTFGEMPFGKRLHWVQPIFDHDDDSETVFHNDDDGLEFDPRLLAAAFETGSKKRVERRTMVPKIDGIAILDAKTAQNLAIVLSRIRIIPSELCYVLKTKSFAPVVGRISGEDLDLLIQTLPPKEELDKLLPHQDNIETLRDVEQQVMPFARLPRLMVLLRIMRVYLSHEGSHESAIKRIQTFRTAAIEVCTSTRLRAVFGIVVRMGNYINHGVKHHSEGIVKGFAVESLSALNSFKMQAGLNATHYICLIMRRSDSNFHEDLKQSLSHVRAASRESLRELEVAVREFEKEALVVKRDLEQMEKSEGSESMEELSADLDAELGELQAELRAASEKAEVVQTYFGGKIKGVARPAEEVFSHIAAFLDTLEVAQTELDRRPPECWREFVPQPQRQRKDEAADDVKPADEANGEADAVQRTQSRRRLASRLAAPKPLSRVSTMPAISSTSRGAGDVETASLSSSMSLKPTREPRDSTASSVTRRSSDALSDVASIYDIKMDIDELVDSIFCDDPG